jgi:hypothetical protein
MRRAAALLLSTSLVLAACSSDDPAPEAAPSTSETTTSEVDSETATESASATETETASPTASESSATPDPTEAGSPVGAEADATLTADLTGAVEVPGPGDPAGSGAFTGTIVMNEAAGELCYQLEVADLASEVTAAHIHDAPEGEAGPVAIELTPPLGGPVDECVTLNADQIVPLTDDPSQFYVNVHTQGHPDGAVRGQLSAE